MLVLGCVTAADEPEITPAARRTMIEKSLANPPSFARLKATSPVPGWKLDGENADYWQITIGDDFPTQFARWENLRIFKRSGTIMRQGYDERLEEVWLYEYQRSD